MTDLGINHLLTLEQSEPHEYYGALNGNFNLGGVPNQYWDSILNTSYYFLYNYINPNNQGDINSDGLLNIQDIVILINFILGEQEATEDQFELADMNNDNILNILDAILIIELILIIYIQLL